VSTRTRTLLLGLLWAVAGIVLAIGLTFFAYAVAARDLSTPTRSVKGGALTPVAAATSTASPRPTPTPAGSATSVDDDGGHATESPDDHGGSDGGSESTSPPSDNSGHGSDDYGSGSDDSGHDDD